MKTFATILLGASSALAFATPATAQDATASDDYETTKVYCQNFTGDADQKRKDCETLAKLLRQAESQRTYLRNELEFHRNRCEVIRDRVNYGDPLSAFFKNIGGVDPDTYSDDTSNEGHDGQSKTKNISLRRTLETEVHCDPEEKQSDDVRPEDPSRVFLGYTLKSDYQEFEGARKSFLGAKKKLRIYETRYNEAARQLLAWQGDEKRVDRTGKAFVASKERSSKLFKAALSDAPKSRDDIELVDCDITDIDKLSNLLAHPRKCITRAEQYVPSKVTWPDETTQRRPKLPRIQSQLATGKSGSNASLTLSGTLSRFDARFVSGDDMWRRPKNLSYSIGAEAKATDGVADIIGGNSNDANFFSLDRLSSTLLLKLSAGLNFFPRQSMETFFGIRQQFLQKAQKACLDSIKASKTKIETNCADEMLLAWIYELNGSKLARKDMVEAFESLIWKSSKKYPQFGFGATASYGQRDKKFHRFSDADRIFQPELVDIDGFFSGDSTLAGAINNKAAYTAGLYGYWHIAPGEHSSFFDGVTARVDGLVKHDLEDLANKDVEICRTDLGGIGDSGVFLNSARCISTLPFEPVFRTNKIAKFELRVASKPQNFFPAMAIAPNFSYEFRDGIENKYRFEFPIYFSGNDKGLNGGVGYAYEFDKARSGDRSSSTVFIFVGKDFSLNGSIAR